MTELPVTLSASPESCFATTGESWPSSDPMTAAGSRQAACWNLPRHHRKALPEVLEETGIKVQAEQLTGVYKNMLRGVVTLAFRCSVIGGHTHPTDEARKVAWLTVDEATREMPEARAVSVTDAVSDKGPFVRIHDGAKLR